MERKIRKVSGRAVIHKADDIDTDRIIPARFVKSVAYEDLGMHVFSDDRASASNHPFDDQLNRGAQILLTGANFGCGSSREHAVAALAGWGIRCIIAESFSTIFSANATANGIPCVVVSKSVAESIVSSLEGDLALSIDVDVVEQSIRVSGRAFRGEIVPGARERLISGTWDPLMELREAADLVEAVAGSLPYEGWLSRAITALEKADQYQTK